MATVDLFDRITVEPAKCYRAALLADYPFLEAEDLQQALRNAAAAVDDERFSIDRVA